jgi:hypothetical protein
LSETIEVIQYNTILRVYGDKLRPAGGEIWDKPEFSHADISERETVVTSQYLPTFGYIPRHFTVNSNDRVVAFDRKIAIGDAASLQSPLMFAGFSPLVCNLPRLSNN